MNKIILSLLIDRLLNRQFTFSQSEAWHLMSFGRTTERQRGRFRYHLPFNIHTSVLQGNTHTHPRTYSRRTQREIFYGGFITLLCISLFAAFHFDGRQNERKKKQNENLTANICVFFSFFLLGWYAKQEFRFKGNLDCYRNTLSKKGGKNDSKKIISVAKIEWEKENSIKQQLRHSRTI